MINNILVRIWQDFRRVLVSALVIIFLLLIWVYQRLWELFYFPQALVFFSVIGVALASVGYLLRFLLRRFHLLDDFMEMLRQRLRMDQRFDGDAEPKIVRDNEWLKQMVESYKPGRRKPDLPLGFTTGGRMVEIKMTGNESHLMLTGGTGLGKGVLMNQMLIAAAMSGLYQVVVVAHSGKDYRVIADEMANIHLFAFGDDPDPIKSLNDYVEAMPLVVRSAYTEVSRRQKLCEQHRVTKVSDLRVEYRPPQILLVIEEFADTAAQIRAIKGAKQLAEMFGIVSAIAKTGRASNVHLVLINQNPVGEIPRSVRSELRMATFAVNNAQDAYWTTNINGSGAEHLYRYSEESPGLPGELIYVAGNAVHTLRPAFTTPTTLEMAARYYSDVKYAGDPEWVYGWGKMGSLNKRQRQDDDPRIDYPAEDAPTQVAMAIPSVNGVATAVAPPVVKAQADTIRRTLTAREVANAAGWLFDNHPAFAPYHERNAFNKLQAQGIMVLLHVEAMTKSNAMELVFRGRNGRYTEFVNLCESLLVKIQKRAAERGVK